VGKKWIRKKGEDDARRVLADSSNAKHRFGFGGEHGSAITESAPKLSDLWYIEYKPVSDGKTSDVTSFSQVAKAVSPIAINTSTMPIDQYGKRIYLPTRVDFPEVTLTMYDTVDGKMFDMAESIYSKFFKNQAAKVTGANAETVLTDSHAYGRKIPDGKHDYYHQHFEKITIYHFFGNLDGPGLGAPPSSLPRNAGHGTLQKIELINPLVTGITFSGSDYSIAELRIMDFTVQPENIIIGKVDEEVTFPAWMSWGMDYMLDRLSPHLKRKNLDEIYPAPVFGKDGREQSDRSRKYASLDRYDSGLEGLNQQKYRSQFDQKQSITDPLRIEEQEKADTNRKLNELMRLYNVQIQNPTEQGNEALERAIKDRIGVIDAKRAERFYTGNIKNYIDEGNQARTPYEATYTNPDIPTFGGIRDSNPPRNQYPSYTTDLGNSLIQELILSFFSKRSFDTNNITQTLKSNLISSMGSTSKIAIDGARIIDGAVRSQTGAYVTTIKADESVVTNERPVVHKTDNNGWSIGVSKAILRLLSR
jgi:hypothetical protein